MCCKTPHPWAFYTSCDTVGCWLEPRFRPRIVAKALSEWLYWQYGEITVSKISPYSTQDQHQEQNVYDWVRDACAGLDFGTMDIFAATALVLMDVVSPLNDACDIRCFRGGKSADRSVSSAEPISQLLMHINQAAVALEADSKSSTGKAFKRSFLTACAIIWLGLAANPIYRIMSLDMNPLLKHNAQALEDDQAAHDIAEAPKAFNDPALTATSTSSMSTEFGSILSLKRRIVKQRLRSSLISEDLSNCGSTQSSRSWWLRKHLVDLTGPHNSTSSRMDSESFRSSPMDIGP